MALVTANQFQTVPQLSNLATGFQQGQQIRQRIDARDLAAQQQEAQQARAAQLSGLQQQVLAGQQAGQPSGGAGGIQTLEQIVAAREGRAPRDSGALSGEGVLLPTGQQQGNLQAQGLQAQQQIEQIFPEQALATQKAAKARFENLELSEQSRINSVVKGALDVQGLPPAQQLTRLTARRNALASNNIDTTDTDEVISLLQAGDSAGANQLIEQAVKAGQGLGVITDTSVKQAELDIKRQNTDLRELERQQRILDRQVNNETNRLRQQELQQKLDAKDRQVNQKKLERQFEADNAVGNVDNSIATIDRLLTGEGLEAAAGISSAFPTVPGSEAANFEAELEVLQSQVFLSQVEKMKGLGALTENEGKKLSSAIESLNLSQSDENLRAGLERVKEQLNKARAKLNAKFGRAEGKSSSLEGLSSADLQGLSDDELQRLLQGAK